MNIININGKITTAADAHIPVDNGSFRYGYGLFETMLVQEGAIRLKQYHWERLFAGLKQLYFDIPVLMSPEWLEEQVISVVKKNKLQKLCRVRLQLFAEGGLYGAAGNQPGFIIECFPLEASTLQLNENGIITGIAAGLNKSMDSLSNLKSCNALIYAMAARQAKQNKWDDALISNTNGNIIESTIANIFWIHNEVVFTPPLSDGCIAGVMRRYVMERIPVKEKSLSVDELMQADEVFLTNAIKTVRWVSDLNNKKYSCKQTKTIYNDRMST
ncbi:MAG: aminotransferase class IV [Chitinophagales bacterium]